MRTLTGDLQTAQRAYDRRPYVQVKARDRFAGIRRYRPDNWYTGAEPDGWIQAICPSDNSLFRARIDGTTLYRSRVTTPDELDTYSSWTSWRTTTFAVAISGVGSNLTAYAVDSSTRTLIYVATSSDSGATWSAFSLAITHSQQINCIAAAEKSGEKIVIVNETNNIRAYRSTGGAYSASAVTSDNNLTPQGLAMHYASDYNVLAVGLNTANDYVLLQRIYGDGFSQAPDTWSGPTTLRQAINGSNVVLGTPHLHRADVYRMTFRERFGGTNTYDRLYHSWSPASADFASALWKEPVPINIDHDNGLALASNATHLFGITPSRVDASDLTVADVDLTDDVLEVDHAEDTHVATRTVIILDNSNGTYDAPGSGSLKALTNGCEITISPGYIAAGTPTASAGPAVWVERIEHRYAERNTVALYCSGAWAWISRVRPTATRQYADGELNVFGILQTVFALAGFEFSSVAASSDISNIAPAFAITPGDSVATAVLRLIERVPDIIFNRGQFFFANEPLAADTADDSVVWTHNPATQHELTSARYVDALRAANHIRTIGAAAANIVGESIDFTEIPLYHGSPAIHRERWADTGTLAADHAAAVARKIELRTTADRIVIPAHAGLEINDVLAITDSRIGLSAAKRRVLSSRLLYSRKRVGAPYTHTLMLGAV